ncbi:alcohol dehydrogenase catalytic domain-containing protein [Brooklawnia cerclae]|uniref:Threonine dehydrogenase-like Zn-dependent dehydrogenase n=1 Tax=Brooklawnia cerclae TaxID=349934 RepID=A0ABX0SIW1_9ACTN|nr:alcohol dehydrogenase catalytic domain-containing protein [Brooklawnia cerclae]NIH58339.1 threonine dehydrogenase-like Zn-dependent dehydrogenase [Brooklawnia cerclae]
MKAVVYEAPGSAALVEVERPTAGPGEVLVRNEYMGICGSDLTIVAGKHPRAQPGQIIGHESVATVIGLGPGSKGLALGDVVVPEPLLPCGKCETCKRGETHVCDDLRLYGVEEPGSLAEATAYEASRLHRVPAGTSLRVAALVEPLAVAVHATGRAPLREDDRVLIVGGGPVGALCAILEQRVGARTLVVEPNPVRRALLQRLSLQAVESTDRPEVAEVGRTGFDVVLECAGVASAARDALKWTRTHGTMIVVALHKDAEVGFDLRGLSRAEKTVTGTRVYSGADIDRAIAIVASQWKELEEFPVSLFPLADIDAALDEARLGQNSLKTLLVP